MESPGRLPGHVWPDNLVQECFPRNPKIVRIRTLPQRPARMAETDYDFYIRYDWDAPEEIVGCEWLGFSSYFSVLDEPGVIPELDVLFDVAGTELKGLTLKALLRWAYERYVVKREPVQVTAAVP